MIESLYLVSLIEKSRHHDIQIIQRTWIYSRFSHPSASSILYSNFFHTHPISRSDIQFRFISTWCSLDRILSSTYPFDLIVKYAIWNYIHPSSFFFIHLNSIHSVFFLVFCCNISIIWKRNSTINLVLYLAVIDVIETWKYLMV